MRFHLTFKINYIQMKTLLRGASLVLSVFLISSCFSGRKIAESGSYIRPLTDTSRVKEGCVIYALPRTVFAITVEMERTIEKPGPYARFAGDLLGLTDIIRDENESWSLKSLTVKPHVEVDPSEYYIIEGNSFFPSNILALNKEGLILYPSLNKFNSTGYQVSGREISSDEMKIFDLASDEYFQPQRDTAYRRVNVDSTFVRIPYIVEKKKRLTTEQLAEKAAKRLIEMRDGMHLILTGEANVFPQSEAAINEINRLEKEYTELFTGKSITQTMTFTYSFVPDKAMTGKAVTLFRYSEVAGPVDNNSKDGIPVTINIFPEKKTKSLTVITVPKAEPGQPVNDKLFYRAPDVAEVQIGERDTVIYKSRYLIYQLGEVVQLPSNFLIGY